MIQIEWPETLEEMITIAVRINERIYTRYKEKQGTQLQKQIFEIQPWKGKKKNFERKNYPEKKQYHQIVREDPGDPMELDEVKKFKKPSREEMARRRVEKACLYCGQGGHYANECPKKKKKAQIAVIQENHDPEGQDQSNHSIDDTSMDEEPLPRHSREKPKWKPIKALTKENPKQGTRRENQEVIR